MKQYFIIEDTERFVNGEIVIRYISSSVVFDLSSIALLKSAILGEKFEVDILGNFGIMPIEEYKWYV